MGCLGVVGDVPLWMIPEKMQGSRLEEVRPMSFRIFVIRLYQFLGDCCSPYRVLLRIQKSSGLGLGSPRGGWTMMILSSVGKALQKAFL